MKTTRRTTKRNLLILSGALLLFLSVNSFSLAYDYQALEIAPLTGYTSSRALGINNAGQVVGRFYNVDSETGEAIDRQAFIWDRTAGAGLLSTLNGESSAWGINSNGFVSGYSYTAEGNQHAVVWNSTTNAITDIGTLRNTITSVYGPTSTAYNLNDLNQVVGSADIPNDAGDFTPFHAFKYSVTTGIVDLGTFTTSSPEWQNGYSIAYDINANGDAVGIAHDSSWAFLPFVYNSSTGMQQLQRDSNYLSGEWYAVVINDNGLIGGHVIAATNQSLLFYWPNKSSAPVKITMPAGFPYGEIYGINASGQMVGIMWSSDQAGATEHAFIFDTTNGVRDLNALIDTSSGWVLNFARDINDKGQIAGYGEKGGLKRGFVLDPSILLSLGDEIVIDFGSQGIWHNTGSGWNMLSQTSPQFMLNFNGSLLADFGSLGVWRFNGKTWSQFSAADPDNNGTAMIVYNGGVIIDFGSLGLWFTADGVAWDKISSVSPEFMSTYGNYAMFDFGSAGVWRYEAGATTNWVQMSAANPDNNGPAIIPYADGVIVDFGSLGLWFTSDGIAWDKLSDASPQYMATYGVYAVFDFGSLGVWRYEDTTPNPTWLKISNVDPENNGTAMVSYGSGIAIDFGTSGLWFTVDGVAWTKISETSPETMGIYSDFLVGDFGTAGVWQFNGTSWSQISTADPDNNGNAFMDVNLAN